VKIKGLLEGYIASILRVEEYAKQESAMQETARRAYMLRALFLLRLVLNREHGGYMFLRKVG
jgi:hypothetical protein